MIKAWMNFTSNDFIRISLSLDENSSVIVCNLSFTKVIENSKTPS